MQIGWVYSGSGRNPLYTRLVRLARGLRQQGHRIELIGSPGSPLLAEAASLEIKAAPAISSARLSLKSMRQLAGLLRETNLDILHCFSTRDLALTLWASRLAGWNGKIFLSEVDREKLRHLPLGARLLANRISGVLLSSGEEKEALRFRPPWPLQKLHVLPMGIELEQYNPDHYDKLAVRREWNIPGNAIVMGMLSRLHPHKGHMEMLRVVRTVVRKARQPVYFLIAGEAAPEQAAYREALRTYAYEELGLHDEVIFTGYYPEPLRFLAALDIFLYLVHRPTTASTLLQAMAMCLPVVAARSKLTDEFVHEDVSGVLIPVKNPNLLAEASLRLINTPSLRRRLGVAGRIRVEERFQLKHTLARLENLYRSGR